MFSIDLIKAKAIEVANGVKELNSIIVESNEVNNPKLFKLTTSTQQVHAMESVVNGGIVEKLLSVGMIYYPYNEAPVQHSLFSAVAGVAKVKRLGIKHYIVVHGMIAVGSYLVIK